MIPARKFYQDLSSSSNQKQFAPTSFPIAIRGFMYLLLLHYTVYKSKVLSITCSEYIHLNPCIYIHQDIFVYLHLAMV